MEELELIFTQIKNFVWGPPLLVLLLGTGVYLTFLLKGMQFRYLWYAFKAIFSSSKIDAKGDISPFEAFMTSLAGAIGTGSIVGVTTGIMLGGLGSLFWMWIMAFFSMATKYAESLLAGQYRVVDDKGEMMGGPMQYIEIGLKWKWMAVVFAIFGAIAAIGTGNLVQVNSIAEAVNHIFVVDPWITGIVLSILTGMVILGGVKSIGHVAGVLVPVMALFYLTAGLLVIAMHIDRVPEAFMRIISEAFHGRAAIGGFVGTTVMMSIQIGVSRSIFTNEAGLGISSIAAAAARTDNPGRQAMITMTGALISTVIVCTITGLVLALTDLIGTTTSSGKLLNGASLILESFNSALPGGAYIVSVGLILFAFSTVIAWGYYGEKCFEYLFGTRSVLLYRCLFTLIVIPGAAIKMELAWLAADIMNGLMAIPNLIALLGLKNVIISETNSFLNIIQKEECRSQN